jgi:hypothetical protein
VLVLLASVFLIIQAFRGFRDWRFSEKVAAAQVLLPFAAAAFGLNALFGATLEKPSKIIAATFTLAAGVLAVTKQVAATMEAHPTGEELVRVRAVSMGGVLTKLLRG